MLRLCSGYSLTKIIPNQYSYSNYCSYNNSYRVAIVFILRTKRDGAQPPLLNNFLIALETLELLK